MHPARRRLGTRLGPSARARRGPRHRGSPRCLPAAGRGPRPRRHRRRRPRRRPTPPPRPRRRPPTPTPAPTFMLYTVSAGDTLTSIARRFKTDARARSPTGTGRAYPSLDPEAPALHAGPARGRLDAPGHAGQEVRGAGGRRRDRIEVTPTPDDRGARGLARRRRAARRPDGPDARWPYPRAHGPAGGPPRDRRHADGRGRASEPESRRARSALYRRRGRAARGETVPARRAATRADREAAFASMDGLLLTGGADLDPARYGAGPTGARRRPGRDAARGARRGRRPRRAACRCWGSAAASRR